MLPIAMIDHILNHGRARSRKSGTSRNADAPVQTNEDIDGLSVGTIEALKGDRCAEIVLEGNNWTAEVGALEAAALSLSQIREKIGKYLFSTHACDFFCQTLFRASWGKHGANSTSAATWDINFMIGLPSAVEA